MLTVAEVAALHREVRKDKERKKKLSSNIDEMIGLRTPAAVWIVKLEGPEEVRGLLEVWAHSGNLVDQILQTDKSLLTQGLLNSCVVSQTDAITIHFAMAALVDKLTNRLEIGLPRKQVLLLQKIISAMARQEKD
jgi:hypothetical protein